MNTQPQKSENRHVRHLAGNGGGEVEEEFEMLSISGKAVTSSVLAACTAKIEKGSCVLPMEFIVFSSDHDTETKQGIQRIEYERTSMIAFKSRKVQSHIRRSLLEKLWGLKAKSVTFEIIEDKRIKVTIS